MFETNKHIEQVESIYEKHKQAFQILENIFSKEHSIPPEVTKDAIRQRILGGIQNELPGKWLVSPNGLVRSLVLYVSAMCYLLWCAIFGRRNFEIREEVLFDYFSPDCDDFYEEIIKELASVSMAGFGSLIDENHKWLCIPPSKRLVRRNRPYSRKPARQVLRAHCYRFGTYWALTRQTGVDFVDIALRLCAEVASHLTCIGGISAKVLVSAHDNGYTPYRYFLYRLNGIGAIFLIQNGGRVELANYFNSYIYSDYYVAWSEQRLADFTEMRCKNKIALGSVKLGRFLLSCSGAKPDIQHDIIFAEQNYYFPHPRNAFYLKQLENLARFSLENPQVKIAFCRRPGMQAFPGLCNKVNSILHGSPIAILDSTSGFSSYEHVLRSRILVTLDSSLRCEAILLGKPVVSCNDGSEDFIVKYSAPCFVVAAADYDVFSNRLGFLLDNLSSPLVSEPFARLQKAVACDAGKDVSRGIADLIKKELQKL